MEHRLKAYAKINLFLNTISKNKDGYHLLEMLNTKISLHDEITIKESDKNLVFMNGVMVSNNIVLDVLNYFYDNYNLNKFIEITIKKNIFIGAGLGGGSSDAAEVIKFINKFFKLELSNKELVKIALKFGTDIVFFLQDKSAVVSGVGEIITNVNIKKTNVLLVNDSTCVDTTVVYKNHIIEEKPNSVEKYLEEFNLGQYNDSYNSLEKTSLKMYPSLIEFKKDIFSISDKFKMTGSGGTYYMLSDDIEELKNINKELIAKNYITHLGYMI